MRIKVTIEMKDDSDLFLTLSVLGLKIKILPKKQKKYKISDYTPKKIAKRDKKAAKKAEKKRIAAAKKKAEKAAKKKQKKEAESKLTRAQKRALKAEKRHKRPPIPDTLDLFLRIIKLFFSGLFKRFHFYVARMRITVGSADACTTALMYIFICNSINPVLNFLDKHSNLHGRKNADILVAPDYCSDKMSIDIKLAFATTIGGLLGVIFKVAFSFIFGWVKITPKVQANTSSTTALPPQSNESTDKKQEPDSPEAQNK